MHIQTVWNIEGENDLAINQPTDRHAAREQEMERQASELEERAGREQLLMRYLPNDGLRMLHGTVVSSLLEEAAFMRLEWQTRSTYTN